MRQYSGFTAFGVHIVMLTAFSFNERGFRASTRTGFRETARRRETLCLGRQTHDLFDVDYPADESETSLTRPLILVGKPQKQQIFVCASHSDSRCQSPPGKLEVKLKEAFFRRGEPARRG